MNNLNLAEVGKRIKRAVNYLIYLEDMDDRKDFSDKFKYDYTNLSKVFKGTPKYTNLKIISRICETYPNIFIESWFVTGEGQMLKEQSSSPPASEKEAVYKELFEKKEKELSDLRTEKDSEIKTLEHRIWKLEQELQVFTSKKKTVQEWEDASDAADTRDGTLGQQ